MMNPGKEFSLREETFLSFFRQKFTISISKRKFLRSDDISVDLKEIGRAHV